MEWREAEERACGMVRRIDDATAEGEKRGKSVARQGREKQIQGNETAGQRLGAGPGPDHGPPEEKPGGEETCLLDRVPPVRAHAELVRRRNVPGYDHRRTGDPTGHGMC